ncbi:MAG TPA: GIY-YIG nuclease family protein [Candidatus Paceibacterota bacterium]|nr:GIY-YIG nuclease family protein [Candidatus Paceibacterota bacterium]
MFWIYVLKSEKFDISYVGSAENIERRLIQHNNGVSKFTKKYRPWKVIYSESYTTRSDALQREKFLKSKSGRKFLKSVVFK